MRTTSNRTLLAASLGVGLIVASVVPAEANHTLGFTHRDGYEFLYPDNLNARGNTLPFGNSLNWRSLTSGHIGQNVSSFYAYNNLTTGNPKVYYSSGHSFYWNGGPGAGGYASENYWDGTWDSSLTNNGAQNAEVFLYMDSQDITTAPLGQMRLAVVQRCKPTKLDVHGTSTSHAYHRTGTGAAASLGFIGEVYFDVSSSAYASGMDYTWAAEFWGQVGNGQRVGTAAQLANDKVVQVWGQSYGYNTWGLVGSNISL